MANLVSYNHVPLSWEALIKHSTWLIKLDPTCSMMSGCLGIYRVYQVGIALGNVGQSLRVETQAKQAHFLLLQYKLQQDFSWFSAKFRNSLSEIGSRLACMAGLLIIKLRLRS